MDEDQQWSLLAATRQIRDRSVKPTVDHIALVNNPVLMTRCEPRLRFTSTMTCRLRFDASTTRTHRVTDPYEPFLIRRNSSAFFAVDFPTGT